MDKKRIVEFRAAEALRNPRTWDEFEIDYGKSHFWLRLRHQLAESLAYIGAIFGGPIPPYVNQP